MLKVDLPSRTLGIVFMHRDAATSSDTPLLYNKVTYCTLYEVEGKVEKQLVADAACCSKKDHFCKARGRKIALARAMKTLGLGKADRAMVWDVYRKVMP